MKPLAIAFDVHGTLAHWPGKHVHSIDVQRLLARVGIDISYQAFDAARQAVFMLDGTKRQIRGWMDFLALLFDRMDVRVSVDVLPAVAQLYEKGGEMTLLPDALDAVRAAKNSGLKTVAFTSLPAFMLGAAGDELLSLLDHYCDNGLIGHAKGARAYYCEIARRLDMRPDRILAVGDEPLCDCILPRECGWQAVWLDRSGTAKSPDATIPRIRSLSELNAYL